MQMNDTHVKLIPAASQDKPRRNLKVRTFEEQFNNSQNFKCSFHTLSKKQTFFTCECVGDELTQICVSCREHCHTGQNCHLFEIRTVEKKKENTLQAIKRDLTEKTYTDSYNEQLEEEKKMLCLCGKNQHHVPNKQVQRRTDKECIFKEILSFVLPSKAYFWKEIKKKHHHILFELDRVRESRLKRKKLAIKNKNKISSSSVGKKFGSKGSPNIIPKFKGSSGNNQSNLSGGIRKKVKFIDIMLNKAKGKGDDPMSK